MQGNGGFLVYKGWGTAASSECMEGGNGREVWASPLASGSPIVSFTS